MQYADLADLRHYAGFDSEEDDDVLIALLAAAAELINGVTDRVFKVEADSTKTFRRISGEDSSFAGRMLYLHPHELAQAATSITGSPTVVYLPDDTPPYSRIMLDETDTVGWTYPTVIVGKWAYSVSPPGTIIEANLRLAKWLYGLRETTAGDRPLVTPEGIYLTPNNLPADILAMLQPYRKLRVA